MVQIMGLAVSRLATAWPTWLAWRSASYAARNRRAHARPLRPGKTARRWPPDSASTPVLKDPVTLQTLYARQGVTPDKDVIAHCQSGQRSAVSYWVLRLLG